MTNTPPRYEADAALKAEATQAQLKALHPTTHVWVAANAGTGKTTVLTRRLLALLLADETLEPKAILALTFTRAAASEMIERLPRLIEEWAAAPADKLQAFVEHDLGLTYAPTMPKRLEALVKTVRQTPPTLTTLHGFAQQVLAALPSAAGLAEGFVLLDESAQAFMLRRVQHETLTALPEHIRLALTDILNEMPDRSFTELTELLQREWWKLEALLGDKGALGITAIMARLDALLDLPPEDECWIKLEPTAVQREALAKINKIFSDEKSWLKILLTDKGKPQANILNKELRAKLPMEVAESLRPAAEHAATMLDGRESWRRRHLTYALLVWSAHIQGAYTKAKKEQGVVDFADLLKGLEQMLKLSNTEAQANWLWHRLDTRYRHLVVDEAQDNNAAQSRIVAWIAQQMMAGDVGANRTVLAVGDVKQSIYRFQGAQPQFFITLRGLMEQWGNGQRVGLAYTFRNGPAVLDVVNAAFAEETISTAVQGEATPWPVHKTVHAARPSRVEFWPLAQEKAQDEKTDNTPDRWLMAHERAAQKGQSGKMLCFTAIAAWLQARYAEGVLLPSTDKPLAWEDVMILAGSNANLALLAGVLRRVGIPVAAAKGVVPAVVEDVVALLRVVYNKADNLACAQVLKGLGGWDDARLQAFGLNLERDTPWAQALPPEERGLQGFLERLPEGVGAPEVVQRAAAWWGLNLETLAPLLGWAESAFTRPDPHLGPWRTLIARLEGEADLPAVPEKGVQLLTVHSAKGLEAPLVILAEGHTRLVDTKDKLYWGEDIVLKKESGLRSALEKRLNTALEQESRADSLRALYVGLTRATDWLVVTGWKRASKA